MALTIDIPGVNGPVNITAQKGSAVVFCGANGSGKTRLAVYIEETLGLQAHRISAHRALQLNPTVARINQREALAGLRAGHPKADNANLIGYRQGHRWHNNAAVSLLNDFDYLVQVLFAEQANTALITHQRNRACDYTPALSTKLEQLSAIWHRLLPQRRLDVRGDDILVRSIDDTATYSAADLSDGERAVFYLIGQTLVADAAGALIIDEPELHVHRSIMDRLWDELEGARPDSVFVFITHDLEFAASRTAQKFIVREYSPTPAWALEAVPETTGFDEQVTTLILGSRQPILFVEGTQNSLDNAIYRCSFPEWTVTPRGSCEDVIHSVVSMRRSAALTRVTCTGIVDADDYGEDDIKRLRCLGVQVLPVSEIENLVLLPNISRAIAEHEGYKGAALERCLLGLEDAVFAVAGSLEACDAVVTRYCRRRIDRLLKRINLSTAANVTDITQEYERQTEVISVTKIAEDARERIITTVRERNLRGLLACYDNKGLFALAAQHLKGQSVKDFKRWLVRVLSNDTVPKLDAAIRAALPRVGTADTRPSVRRSAATVT